MENDTYGSVKYEILKPEDFVKAVEYCKTKGIDFAVPEICIVAKNGDEIKGLINMRLISMIEPLAADNALIANKLNDFIEGFCLTNKITNTRILADDYVELFEKAGYKKVFEDKILLEKIRG